MTREEAYDILDHNWTRLVNPDYTDEELGDAQNLAIELLKEPKQGEWNRVGADIWECSQCKQLVQTRDIDCYKFCHRCGARMGKGGDEK